MFVDFRETGPLIVFTMNSTLLTSFNDTPYDYSFSYNFTDYYDDLEPPIDALVNIAIMVLLFIIGIPANAIVIIVLLFSRTKGFSVTSMYIINMAVVDLLMLSIQIPMKIGELVAVYTDERVILIHVTPWLCKIAVGTIYVNMTVSILTLMALSITRYCAVMHPVGTRADR